MRHLALLVPLALAGCGDNWPEPGASLDDAEPAVLGRAIASASGADARELLDLAAAPPAGHAGTITVEDTGLAAAGTRVTFAGYRDDLRVVDGVIEVVGSASLHVELAVTIDDLATATTLWLACESNDLCHVARDSWLSIGDLGDATIRGAWRQDPRGGYLTLAGEDSLTFDFNAPVATGCIPYTIDGEAGGELCDEPIVP
jgi:hypothetical protein